MIKLQNLLAENMRRFGTKNLSEQAPAPATPAATTAPAAKPATPSPIPGFVFAEDDAAWLGPNGSKTTNQINEENYNRIFKYYGVGQGLDPSALIGKLAFAFKPITDPKRQMQYSKEFLDPRMFTIKTAWFNPQTKAGSLYSDKMAASTFIQIMPYSVKTERIILTDKAGVPGTAAYNPVFAAAYYKLSTDPKFVKPAAGAAPSK